MPIALFDRYRRSFICHYLPASSTEVGQWYRPLYAFDGALTGDTIADATGSGPCGTDGGVLAGPH